MSCDLHDALERLIAVSLVQWGCAGVCNISRGTNAVLMVKSSQHCITVERASHDLPFRWIVHVGRRQRAAASVVGVLRIIRQSLVPGYAPGHVSIAPLPPAPQ